MPPKASEYVSGVEAARRIGISPQAIGQWGAKSDAPVRVRRGVREYAWPQFPRWREEQLLSDRGRTRMGLSEAEERKAGADAALAELRLERERGAVVPASEVRAAAEEEAIRVQTIVLQLPTDQAAKLAERLGCTVRDAMVALRDVADALARRLAEPDIAADREAA
jgi:hypothetical protein